MKREDEGETEEHETSSIKNRADIFLQLKSHNLLRRLLILLAVYFF